MKDVRFDVAVQFDTGKNTSIALSDDGLVVEIHQSESREADLYYRFGTLHLGSVQLPVNEYVGKGKNPSVSARGRSFAVVYESASNANHLSYRVGTYDNGKLKFSDEKDYEPFGAQPALAMNVADTAVSLHVNPEDGRLLYRVGRVDAPNSRIIGFDPPSAITYANDADRPAVALNDRGFVVSLHIKRNSTEIMYAVGKVEGNSIRFGEVKPFGTGQRASVALTNDGIVIFATQSTEQVPRVILRSGQLNEETKTITFPVDGYVANQITRARFIQKIQSVSVATDGEVAIESYGYGGVSLWVSASIVADRAHWMGDALDSIGNMTLRQISIPGAHDSTTYEIHDCTTFGKECNSRTQRLTFLEQLNAGIRYFDVRPVYYKGAITTAHLGGPGIEGCNGAPLTSVLRDVAHFLVNSREVVILKFSHYVDRDAGRESFTDSQKNELITQVTAALRQFLYTGGFTGRLAMTAINTLVKDKGIVLPVFDDFTPNLLRPGAYRYADLEVERARERDLVVYDKFAETDGVTALENDQYAKLRKLENHSGDLFLFSWTLTQPALKAPFCKGHYGDSIEFYATLADTALPESVSRHYKKQAFTPTLMANVIYVDLASHFAADMSMLLNQRLYRYEFLHPDRNGHLIPGDVLYSSSGLVRLIYQEDGDLVLFGRNGNRLWHSNTRGDAWRCIMQGDGNFVIYDKPFHPVCDSRTFQSPGAFLKVQNDDKVIIYSFDGTKALRQYPGGFEGCHP